MKHRRSVKNKNTLSSKSNRLKNALQPKEQKEDISRTAIEEYSGAVTNSFGRKQAVRLRRRRSG